MKIVSLLLFITTGLTVFAQEQPLPKVNGYVTDEAGIFTPDEINQLNAKLKALDDSTGNQIAIFTTLDLRGREISDFAFYFIRENGIGQKDKNNGVAIIIKPKTAEGKGKAFIAPGYGLEGALPDAVCKRIVEQEMIPAFKQGNYFTGVDRAAETVSKLASGEYSAKDYTKKGKKGSMAGTIILVVIIAVFVLVFFSGSKKYGKRNDLPLFMAASLFSSMTNKHSGIFNDFNSGGGDFGGFGGGSSGGGGAGGEW